VVEAVIQKLTGFFPEGKTVDDLTESFSWKKLSPGY
jgi:hypothetical protein